MCAVCALWEKGKLTAIEAEKAIVELSRQDSSEEFFVHLEYALEKIWEDEEDARRK